MKKIFLPFVFIVLFLSSCTSTKISINDNSPIALISVVGNTSVPWFDASADTDENSDDGNGLLSSTLNNIIDGNNPERQTGADRVDYAEESIRFLLKDIAGVEVLDKETVLNSPFYKKLRKSFYNITVATVEAEGYKDLSRIGSKSSRVLMNELKAKSLLLAEFDFKKQLVKGTNINGEVCGICNMNVTLIDKNGKVIIEETFTSETERIPITKLKYDRDRLVELLPVAIDDSIRKFIVNYLN